MGCGGSKVDDLPLVMRCKERKELIKSAMEHQYDLSSSHLAYFHSLKGIGHALSRFVDEELVLPSPSAASPVLTLPSSDQGKTNKSSGSSGSISHIHSIDGNQDPHLYLSSDSASSAGGHIHIHDDDGHDDDDSGPENKNKPSSTSSSFYPPYNQNQTNWDYPFVNRGPPPNQPHWVINETNQGDPYGKNSAFESAWGPYGGNFDSYYGYGGNSNSYYMKKSAPASRTVIHQEEARGFQETGQWPDPSDYSSYESGFFSGYGIVGPPPPPQEPKQSSPVKDPPPPPSPKVSGWDFLNFFDANDNVYQSYGYGYGSMASSPDLSEVRAREGIPDLEEETESESHNKEVNFGKKLNTQRNTGEGTSRSVPKENIKASALREQSRSSEGSSRRMPPGNSEGTSKETHDESNSNSLSSQNNEGAQSVNIQVDSSSPETVVSGSMREKNENKKGVSFDIDEGSIHEVESSRLSSLTPETVVSESIGEKNENKKGVSFDIDEESIHEVESSRLSSLTTLSAHGSRDLQEVFNEIKDEFDIAFGYGKEVAVMLEAGKVPYQPRFAVFKVILSRVLYLVAPSFSFSHHVKQPVGSRSQVMKLARSYHLDAVANVRSINLSSTLEKLYVWEKKLYKEVKDEERLRLIYEKMCKRLKDLDARGAEPSKIDAARASIRRLLTKLNVCIKAIDAISSKIQKLRDEELQPQVNELICGLIRMWKLIVKCHQRQFKAIMESKTLTLNANSGFRGDSSLSATLELETDLLIWCRHFKAWVNAQKAYAVSLNGWLRRCIDHEPEVTIDGEVPFSPGRIGAPPIFVICNDWHEGIKSVSEEQVSKAIHTFASNLRQLLERQDDEQRQRVKTEYLARDFWKKRRQHLQMGRGKEEQDAIGGSDSGVSAIGDLKVDLDTLRKKMDEERARHKEAMKLVNAAASSSLQGGIIPIFKALENFTCDALKAHEQVRLQNQAYQRVGI